MVLAGHVALGMCERHDLDTAVDLCRRCRDGFCETCLVYPFGPAEPALCLDCALAVGGVRRRRVRRSKQARTIEARRAQWREARGASLTRVLPART